MSNISAKFFEVIRNLKSDASPKAPRTDTNSKTNDVKEENKYGYANTSNSTEHHENSYNSSKNDKAKENTFHTKKNGKKIPEHRTTDENKRKNGGVYGNTVNTQATGYVINIVDSKQVRCGNNFIYQMGPSKHHSKYQEYDYDHDEEIIEKNNLIVLLMEANTVPEHEYIDYVAKNLGRNWRSFFVKLGYRRGRIETFEIDEAKNGVSEARYKLLLDWVRNDDIGTLGRLATLLWEEGERVIVKDLSLIYSKKT